METIQVYDMKPSSGRKRSASPQEDGRLEPHIEIEQDICRHVINTELMMLHGYNVDGYLPPLPQQTKPRSSLVAAWSCENPALRQLGNISRRGPRNRCMPGSAVSRSVDTVERKRPHTSYCAHVRGVLNTKPTDIRPQTAGMILDRANDKKLQPVKNPQGLILPTKVDFSNIKRLLPFLIMKERLGEMRDDVTVLDYTDLQSEIASTVGLAGGGLRKPKLGLLKNKKKSNRGKGMQSFLDMERQLNENISRVLKGDLDQLPHHPPTAVRVYLCSHPHDMQAEKTILEREAYPELREYSQKLGVELLIIDTHLPQSAPNPEDIIYRRREIRNCQNHSVGPNFVVLLGDHYGPAAIPVTLTLKDYQFLHKAASVSTNDAVNTTLLEECYKRDDNIIPPAYLLQEPEKMSARRCNELRFILKESVFTAIQIGKFRPEREKEFATSELEHLLRDGILRSQGDLTAIKCLCFHRKFQGIHEDLDNDSVADYTDVLFQDGKVKVDGVRQERLDNLASAIHSRLGESNMKGYEVTWMGGDIREPGAPEHQVYLKQLVRDFVEGMKRLIVLNNSQWKSIKNTNFALYREVLHHSKICSQNIRLFINRSEPLNKVKEFFNNHSHDNRPLVIQGNNGVGKSSILAHIYKAGGKLIEKPQWVAIYRQIGLTPDSSQLRTLLVGILQQLGILYNMDAPSEFECRSVNNVVRIFANTLEIISKHNASKRPLLILIDDAHKLPPKDRADTFFWLPKTCPKNVTIILTLNNSATVQLEKLHHRIGYLENFITVGEMNSREVSTRIDMVLAHNTRQITEPQKAVIKKAGTRWTHPMLVQIREFDIIKWKSSWEQMVSDLPDTVHNGIAKHLDHLQRIYGSSLVRTIAMYLTLLPSGITETELGDVCVSTSSVIKEMRYNTRITNPVIYTMTRTRTSRILDYLETMGLMQTSCFHNRTLLSWSNDLTRDIVSQLYFNVSSASELHENTQEDILNCHSHLRELFSQDTGIWLEDRILYSPLGTCAMTPQLLTGSNIRKLNLLPYLISQCDNVESEDMETFLKRKCLCDYMWLLTKLQATGFTTYMEDLRLIKGHDLEVDLVLDFVSLCGFGLQQNPLSLALQMLGTIPYMHASRYPLVAEMIEVAKAWMIDQKFPLLMPAFMCFPSPLDQCKARMWGIIDVQMITPANNMGVVKNKDGFLEIWDMASKEWVYQMGLKYDKLTANIFSTDDFVLGINTPHTLQVWEIETGFEKCNVNLLKIFGENSNISCHAYTTAFDKIAFHTSDDDFNQTFSVLDTHTGSIILKSDKFDLKDEFFPNAAAFVTIEGQCWLTFINARSEIVEDDKPSMDTIRLNIYNVTQRRHRYTVTCGHAKFVQLLTKGNKYAIICWDDCSFDVYDIESGTHFSHLPSPDAGLAVQSSAITEDDYLVALASTTGDHPQRKCYHGFWFWNIEESSTSELFVADQEDDEEAPKHFIVIEELHLAILGTQKSAKVSIWDIPTSTRIYSLNAHVGGLDRIIKSPDPYRIYTCSAGEKVVKLWDLHNLVTCAKDQDSQKDIESDTFEMPSVINSRSTSSASNSSDKTPDSILKPTPCISRMKSGRSTRKSVRFAQYTEVADDLSLDDNDSFDRSDSISAVDSHGSDARRLHGERVKYGPARLPDGDMYINVYPHSAAGSTANMEISEFIGAGSESLASDDGMSSADDSNDMEAIVYGNTGQITMHSQLENMFDVTIMQYTKDSEFVITGSTKGLPTIWDVKTGFPHLHMRKQSQDDVCTPWFSLACKDKYIIGLTGNNRPVKEGWPQQYKFQVWKRESGKAHIPKPDMDDIFVIKCEALSDGERALVSILDNYKPGQKAEVRMQIIHIERLDVLRMVRVFMPELPDLQQVTGDCMYTILMSPGSTSNTQAITVYNLEDEANGEYPPPCCYQFRSGTKFKKYGATSNIILRNGISLAAGLNGDIQLWDIGTGEYEGNLYCDPNVKDKANPSLHNHNGKQIYHMALSEDGRYLVCGGGDGTTSLWDLEHEVMMHSYQGHKEEVRRVVITWDNQLVLTAGSDCMLFVWPFAGDKPICQLFIHVVASDLQISEDKKTVCVIGNRQNEASRFMMFRLMNLRKLT